MNSLLFLLLSSAFAQDQVASVEECPFTPIAAPPPTRPPGALAPSRKFVECIVTAEVDGKGVPTARGVEGCEEPFASAARAGFATWRFQPCVLPDGRAVEATIKVVAQFASSEFQLQGDAAYTGLMEMHQPGRAVKEGCAASLRILPDGTVEDLTSSDVTHCISAARKRTLKHYHLELKKAQTCTLEMDVTGAQADLATAKVADCNEEVGTYVINAVTSFPWNSPIGGSEHYTVKVTVGPE